MSDHSRLMSPLISVVMCTYNTRHYIEAAVQSIMQQTYDNWELIVCDDGSTDGTREWLRQWQTHPKVRLFFQKENIGYVANKNFAIRQAKGDYITQNDSDDFSTPNRFEQQVAAIHQNPQFKIIACGYYKIDNEGNIYQKVGPEKDVTFNRYPGVYPFWFPPLLVHKEVYQKVGLFTNYFSGIGDDLYWTVKANEQYSIYCIKDSLYFYRDNPDSITNVLDDTRKLIVWGLLKALLEQRMQTGSDWLEKNDKEALKKLELTYLRDRKFMSEGYRIWAAKAVDKNNWNESLKLLRKSFSYNALNISWYRTLLYFIRKKYADTTGNRNACRGGR